MKAHRLLYHSTLGWRVIKKKRMLICPPSVSRYTLRHSTLLDVRCRVSSFRVAIAI